MIKGEPHSKRSRNQDQAILPQSSRNTVNQQSSKKNKQPQCQKCKSAPKTKIRKYSQGAKAQPVVGKKLSIAKPCEKHKRGLHNQSKSVYEELQKDSSQSEFDNEVVNLMMRKRKMRRQASSYCRLNHAVDTMPLGESSMADSSSEKKFKQLQNELLSTKSKMFENECELDNFQNEVRKLKRDNRILNQKLQTIETDIDKSQDKCHKYKQLAKNYRSGLQHTQLTLDNYKKISQEEIKTLQSNLRSLETLVKQRSVSNTSNFKTIESYLNKLHKMVVPSDQNFSFNVKILGDLSDLCRQLQKMQTDEEQSLKSSLVSSVQNTNQNKTNGDLELVFSQTTNNDFNQIASAVKPQQDLDENTKRLIGDYERLKYESERTRRENAELKERNDTLSFMANEEQAKLGHYDSKESLQTKQQSLTVADLLQMDSVQKLNSKLEEKNSYLEQQIDLMKEQMNELSSQTRELMQERQQFQDQKVHKNTQLAGLTQRIGRKLEGEVMSTDRIKYNPLIQVLQGDDGKTEKWGQYNQKEQSEESMNFYLRSPERQSEQSSDGSQQSERQYDKIGETLSFRKKLAPSQSSSNIVSSRDQSASGSRRKINVFKRNIYLESDKENHINAVNSSAGTFIEGSKQADVFQYNQEDPVVQNRPSIRTNILSSTSPSVFGGTSAQSVLKQNARLANQTHRHLSNGSASSVRMHEKSKVLRDEILTLDDEIFKLQDNLQKAIQKKQKTRV